MDEIRGQQHMFVDGRRADLLLRFTQDCEKGAADDWLVVENKTTAVGIGALDQLALSVDWLRAESRLGRRARDADRRRAEPRGGAWPA